MPDDLQFPGQVDRLRCGADGMRSRFSTGTRTIEGPDPEPEAEKLALIRR